MKLIDPHGGVLSNLLANSERVTTLAQEIPHMVSLHLTPLQVWDLELLLVGGFSPLSGFMGMADYQCVLTEMRLKDGLLWPMPITLDVTEEFAASVHMGDRVALRHPDGVVLAVLTISDIWRPNLHEEAQLVFGSQEETHPAVFRLFHQTNSVYLGGSLEGLEVPPHHTFKQLRHTPTELRDTFTRWGWSRVVAFQTRNPMHRAHIEMTARATKETGANLLIHPIVGPTRPGDVDYFTRVKCYITVMKDLPQQTSFLSLLPLAMRLGGPREALWHGIIRKNYGCSHIIIGRDHAGPGINSEGKPFYDPYGAQEIFVRHQRELGIQMVGFEEMVYVPDLDEYMERSEVPKGARQLSLSGTELRRRLHEGSEIPGWFSYPEVVAQLRESYTPKNRQGFTVFFTGLSGSGKSTIANALMDKLLEIGGRAVTLLDGDIVRKNLASELGFSKEHRDINIRRIGFVAGEITRHGGAVICAAIAPYEATRREVREAITKHGCFVEVYVSTPLDICEERDKKGLYAQARAGTLQNFTGISDPYEPPRAPELSIDASLVNPDQAAEEIVSYLTNVGFIDRKQ